MHACTRRRWSRRIDAAQRHASTPLRSAVDKVFVSPSDTDNPVTTSITVDKLTMNVGALEISSAGLYADKGELKTSYLK